MYLTGPVYEEEKDVLTGSGKREGWIEQVQVKEKRRMNRTGSC